MSWGVLQSILKNYLSSSLVTFHYCRIQDTRIEKRFFLPQLKGMRWIEGWTFLAPVKGFEMGWEQIMCTRTLARLKTRQVLTCTIHIFQRLLLLHQIKPGTDQTYLQTSEDSSQRCSHTHNPDSETDCGKVDANKSSLVCHQSVVTGSCLDRWKIQLQ